MFKRIVRASAASVVVALVANVVIITSASAQLERNLQPAPSENIPIIPFMEGWYENEDGSVTFSFGYHNRNEAAVVLPMTEDNRIEPETVSGMQPEIYLPGRHHGVFAVTIPDSMIGETVWWHLNSANQELKVPGDQQSTTSYELDRNPRPQGSVQPLIGFIEDGKRGSGPEGIEAEMVLRVAVDEPITLEVWTEDPSDRDRTDPRFAQPLDTRVSWYEHQGPGRVTFTAHESMEFIETADRGGRVAAPAHAVAVPEGVGPGRVNASFSEPGEYVIRARVDNWRASDSDGLDQCCWSNAYQRVLVTD